VIPAEHSGQFLHPFVLCHGVLEACTFHPKENTGPSIIKHLNSLDQFALSNQSKKYKRGTCNLITGHSSDLKSHTKTVKLHIHVRKKEHSTFN